jgi:thiamine biosynthesis lipoprotein
MGTRFDLVLLGKNKITSESIWKRIVAELQRLDKKLNRFDSKSEISFINLNAYNNPVEVNEEMWSILNHCHEYYKKTSGLFDITLKNFSQLIFNETSRSIKFISPDVKIDLGGYAKGYALQRIKQLLDEDEVDQAFVDFGNSSILGIGHHPYGKSWQVSIQNPYNREETLGVVDLIDKYLSTSGNSPTHTKHIINPQSGELNDSKKIVTIISENALEAEVLSTTLMIASEEQLSFLENKFDFQYKIYNL